MLNNYANFSDSRWCSQAAFSLVEMFLKDVRAVTKDFTKATGTCLREFLKELGSTILRRFLHKIFSGFQKSVNMGQSNINPLSADDFFDEFFH
jgi:hypothetical protein